MSIEVQALGFPAGIHTPRRPDSCAAQTQTIGRTAVCDTGRFVVAKAAGEQKSLHGGTCTSRLWHSGNQAGCVSRQGWHTLRAAAKELDVCGSEYACICVWVLLSCPYSE